MKRLSLPALVLILAPALGYADDTMSPPMSAPPSGTTRQTLSRSISEMQSAFKSTNECLVLEAELKADLAKKKKEFSSEFKGNIPVAFNSLLWQKTERINRQHAACYQQHDALGKMFEELGLAFGSIEPKNLNVKKEKAIYEARKTQYLRMVPTAKPHNRPKPKQAAE